MHFAAARGRGDEGLGERVFLGSCVTFAIALLVYAPVGPPAGAGCAHCCCRTRTAVLAAGYVTQCRSRKRSLNASQLYTLESDPQDVTSPDMRMQHPALALTWPYCGGLAALSILFGRHASSNTAQREGARKSGHTQHGQHAVRSRSGVRSAHACHGLHAVRSAGHGQRFATPGHCALAGVGRRNACPTRPWHRLGTWQMPQLLHSPRARAAVLQRRLAGTAIAALRQGPDIASRPYQPGAREHWRAARALPGHRAAPASLVVEQAVDRRAQLLYHIRGQHGAPAPLECRGGRGARGEAAAV